MKFLLKLFMLFSKYTLRLFIIQVICMNLVLAKTSNSQDLDKVKVSITLKHAKIEDVFKKIEEKTDYVFAYSEILPQEVQQIFNLKYSNVPLRKVLQDLSAQANVQFKLINKTISVAPVERIVPVVMPIADMLITGNIKDDSGQNLPGVNVVEKGTTNGATSDSEGKFSIRITDVSSILVFSFIGYASQEVLVGNNTVINVTLNTDTETLQEVVVIGYQSVDKKDLTGATSVIKPTESAKVTSGSLAESIQGLAPGVTVRNGGGPGQAAVIEIRGASSFTNTSPLYVIDGMIADANPTINSNDIESIQILKDASAAAIYGSRAGNGVVIITTKQGKEGPAKVSFTAKYGIQQVPKKWDVMDASEYAAMKRTQYENSGLTPPPSVAVGTFDPSINTDWQSATIRTGSMQDYNVTLSGGTTTGNYLMSGSYYKNEGILIGNSFERSSLRINTRSKKGRVTLGENMVLTNSVGVSPGDGNPFYDMPQMLPVIPIKSDAYVDNINNNPEGWGIGTNDAITYAWNPVAIKNLSSRKNNFAKIVGNAFIEARITKWLNYKFDAGLEASFDYSKYVRKQGKWSFNQPYVLSNVNEDRSRFLNTKTDHTLNFNKDISDHHLDGVLGYTSQHITRDITSGGRNGLQQYDGQYMTTINSATGVSTSAGSTPDNYRIYGFLGRVNYSYKHKYLLTLTGRNDHDSRFSSKHRSGFYPSVAGGWRISDEKFFKVPFINDLKLYGSYGELGIVTIGSWDYTAFLNSNPRTIFGPDQTPNVGATQARLSNRDIRWEHRIVKNVGVTTTVFNRLSVSVEAYNTLAKDVLVYLPVAWYLGNLGGDPAVNAGSIRNTGIEFSATYKKNDGPLKWDISGNFTTIKNRVLDVGNRGEGIDYLQIGATRSQVGHAMGQWYVLKTAGLFQSQDEIDSYRSTDGKIVQPNAKPGDVKYIDKNDDGEINDKDRTFSGSPWPKLQAGAQFNASYKNFTLNLQFVGIFGYTIYNDVRRILDSYQSTNFRKGINPWTPENTNTSDPRIGVSTNDQGLVDNGRYESDRWLEKGSYVRLRNVEIGYSIPSTLLKKAGVSSARFYVSGQNLFTITKYTGLSPDIVGNGIFERGVDNGNWPPSRVFSIGLQCDF